MELEKNSRGLGAKCGSMTTAALVVQQTRNVRWVHSAERGFANRARGVSVEVDGIGRTGTRPFPRAE